MTEKKGRKTPSEDGVVYLDPEGRDDVARALEEAERAVSVVEQRQRKQAEETAAAPGETGAALAVPDTRVPAPAGEEGSRLGDLEGRLLAERERAVTAEEEAGRLREALLRKVADFENLKRRTDREKDEYFKFALGEFLRELLPVLDNFERGLRHAGDATGAEFHAGIEIIARQMVEVLRRYGVSEVPALGLPFDPNVHEAVTREETPSAVPGTVLEVFQKGYLLNDRLLRPARVKVSAAAPPGEGS